ncbi:MAG: AAA family ATPase [Rubrivivax sp.]|nr:AAA family ATPase [Rubrivivax sp.]
MTVDSFTSRAGLQQALDSLHQGLLERGVQARLVLLTALAGQHALLIGPPGTAKSELARRLHRCFAGAAYFERLLTRFSTPEELFGPLSLKALEDDRYERLVQGFLPTAGIAFLDEVFKANSAILNALLTLLNEREFDNGSGRCAVPLISVVAASNEVPADEALQAFHDRFLVRIPVGPVSDAAFAELLRLGDAPAPAEASLRTQDLQAWAHEAAAVDLSDDLLAGCAALRQWLTSREIRLSDRRWRQWMDLLRMAAATEGRAQADLIDLWTAPFVASPTPQEVEPLARWFREDCLQAVPQLAPWLTRAVEAFEKQFEIESTAGAEDGDDSAGKMALARAISGAGRSEAGEGLLRVVSARLEDRLRRHYSPVHIAARLAQLDELLTHVALQRADNVRRHDELAARLAGRLWLPPEFSRAWLEAYRQTLDVLDALAGRLQQLRAAFASLPQEASSNEDRPQPVQWSEAVA